MFSPNPEAPVLVIGAAGVDMVGRLTADLNPGMSNPAQIRTSFGGVGRNVAENLARLGQPVQLLTVVGAGEVGDRLLEGVQQAGVDVSQVARSPRYPTGTYLGVVNTSGELQFALDDMRAISELSSEYVRQNAGLFAQASAVFVDANLPKETLRTVFSLARKAGLPVCADPAAAALAVKLKPYLSRLRLLTCSSTQAAVLVDRPAAPLRRREALQAAKELVAQGVETVIITRSDFSACYATSTTSGQAPAIRPDIFDPTGAGDALAATVLFALLNEIAVDDAVRLGVSAAALTLGYRGAVLPELSLQKLYDSLGA